MSMCVSRPKQLYIHTPPSFPSERAPPFGATFVKVFLHPGSAPRLILITEEKMGQGTKPAFCGAVDEELCDSDFFSSDSSSGGSLGSSSSDLTDDAASSPSGGPLYELSSLMAQLPIKRGLSSFFSGKSQSFTSLSNVRCAEDLAKKEAPYRRKMKPCKSYGGMLDLSNNRSCFAPGPYGRTISKKSSRVSCASLAAKRSSSGLFGSPKPPPVPVQKNM